jgi:hypothetical protein
MQAAWPVAVEQYVLLDHEEKREEPGEKRGPIPVRPMIEVDFFNFARTFRKIIEEETVPAGFPFGVSYDSLAEKLKKEIPAKVKKVRGKLNIPRERFHSIGAGQYQWAGLQFKAAPHLAAR